jgi:trans-aconitate methyltransferase
MGTEQSAAYYDRHLKNFLVPYETSRWRPLYDHVLTLMPEDRTVRICDIACGTGRMAKLLWRNGYHNYVGFDFSLERIKEARHYVPEASFHHLDAFSDEARALSRQADVAIITDTLEHLEQDLELISVLPKGMLVIGSVPNFDSKAHVRMFDGPDTVFERYGDLVSFTADSIFTQAKEGSKNEIYIFSGRRR